MSERSERIQRHSDPAVRLVAFEVDSEVIS